MVKSCDGKEIKLLNLGTKLRVVTANLSNIKILTKKSLKLAEIFPTSRVLSEITAHTGCSFLL